MQAVTIRPKVVNINVQRKSINDVFCTNMTTTSMYNINSCVAYHMLGILLFNITLLERSSVYINIATKVLTCFAVFAGKARLTVAMIFMMDIFITCCSVFTVVIFVTAKFGEQRVNDGMSTNMTTTSMYNINGCVTYHILTIRFFDITLLARSTSTLTSQQNYLLVSQCLPVKPGLQWQ